jgi:thymidine phosphorylase
MCIRDRAKIGDTVATGDVLGVLICRNERQALEVSEGLRSAYRISVHPVERPQLVLEII